VSEPGYPRMIEHPVTRQRVAVGNPSHERTQAAQWGVSVDAARRASARVRAIPAAPFSLKATGNISKAPEPAEPAKPKAKSKKAKHAA
jgi:hypothetical protein